MLPKIDVSAGTVTPFTDLGTPRVELTLRLVGRLGCVGAGGCLCGAFLELVGNAATEVRALFE